jgi:hypothetical protein
MKKNRIESGREPITCLIVGIGVAVYTQLCLTHGFRIADHRPWCVVAGFIGWVASAIYFAVVTK